MAVKPVDTRRLLIRAGVTAAMLSLPAAAAAQRQPFFEAVFQLREAGEGTYGNEGARIGPALDAMSRALDAWDREIALLERRDAGRAADLALARTYVERGRATDALDRLDRLARVEPAASDVQTARGLVLESMGNAAGAADAFRRAWAAAPTDPVAAYYAWRALAAIGNGERARLARAVLTSAYGSLPREPGGRGAPFERIAPLEAAAGGMPLLPLAAYRDGFEQLAKGQLREAIDAFRRAASADPLVRSAPVPSGPLARAIAALEEGSLADARSLLQQPGAVDSSEARRVLGLIHWAESDFDRSIEQLEAAIASSPDDERSRLALFRVLSSAGRQADARRVLEDTLRVLPASGRAHWWLATGDERVNRFADARREFEQAAAMAVAGRSFLLGAVGRLASGATDNAGAIRALSGAVDADPANPAWHRLLAGAYLLEDRPDDALAEFVATLLIDPRDADAHLGVGQIYLNGGRTAEAVEALRRATELNAGSLDAAYALATALMRLGNAREAAPLFERVERAQRERLLQRRRTLSIDALREEAALRTGERDHAGAEALWRQVIQRDPQHASDHAGLAAVLASAGRADAAIEEYERAASLGAEPVVWHRLAELYTAAGRAPDAARARVLYEAALRRGSPAP